MTENYDNILLPFNNLLKEYFGKNKITGIEIGVETGKNSLRFLNSLNIEKLYLIDPYIPYREQHIGRRFKFNSQEYVNSSKKESKKRLSEFNNIEFIYKKSKDAIIDIKTLCDFVYIDGDHSYNTIKSDIKLYKEIVKKGGILGGDDYISRWSGVIKAVDEFIEETGYKLNIEKYKVETGKTPEGYFYDFNWWVVKE